MLYLDTKVVRANFLEVNISFLMRKKKQQGMLTAVILEFKLITEPCVNVSITKL